MGKGAAMDRHGAVWPTLLFAAALIGGLVAYAERTRHDDHWLLHGLFGGAFVLLGGVALSLLGDCIDAQVRTQALNAKAQREAEANKKGL